MERLTHHSWISGLLGADMWSEGLNGPELKLSLGKRMPRRAQPVLFCASIQHHCFFGMEIYHFFWSLLSSNILSDFLNQCGFDYVVVIVRCFFGELTQKSYSFVCLFVFWFVLFFNWIHVLFFSIPFFSIFTCNVIKWEGGAISVHNLYRVHEWKNATPMLSRLWWLMFDFFFISKVNMA